MKGVREGRARSIYSSFFGFAFCSSSAFSRSVSETSRPSNLAFQIIDRCPGNPVLAGQPGHRKTANWAQAFQPSCVKNDLDHRTAKAKRPWTSGQVERMNRPSRTQPSGATTIMKATTSSSSGRLRLSLPTSVEGSKMLKGPLTCSFAKLELPSPNASLSIWSRKSRDLRLAKIKRSRPGGAASLTRAVLPKLREAELYHIGRVPTPVSQEANT